MNRNAGISAGVIALIAFVIHLSIPTAQESRLGGNTPASTQGTEKKKTAGSKTDKGAENELEGPWLATRYFFGYAQPINSPAHNSEEIDFTSVPEILSCAGASSGDKSWTNCGPKLAGYFGIADRDRDQVEFLLAMVPDPLHTHLSLFTDSAIQALQSAATRAGWVFATQWLPWNDTVDPNEKDHEKRRHDRRTVRDQEKQPGLLVFRHKVDCTANGCKAIPRVLLVFLLGETPTAGVNPAQFQIARAYMTTIKEPDKARILGPTFSGSFDSLMALIRDDKTAIPGDKRAKTTYLIQSGTATDTRFGEVFRKLPGVEFHSATTGRDFRDVLTTLRIGNDEAAVLVEDESGYGEAVTAVYNKKRSAIKEHQDPIRIFRFPRDISHLRNAYREATQTTTSKTAPAPDLDFSLKDTEIGEDSIPVFSKTQSPLSQNSVLNEIMGAIQRDRIRIVQINATNVLDLLFLAQVLKRQCPDTRIVIPYADLLFVEAAQTDALTGTLALSTYPIFSASNEWLGQRELPATFSDSNSEGYYNAAALLLDPTAVLDYHWNGRGARMGTPPTWLLTVDREGFLPVRVWTDPPGGWFAPGPERRGESPHLPMPSTFWILISTTTSLVSFGLLTWMFFLSRKQMPMSGAQLGIETLAEGSPADRWRVFFVYLAALLLAAIDFIIWVPFWHNAVFWSFAATLMPAASIAASLLAAGLALAGMCRNPSGRYPYVVSAAIAAAASLIIVSAWVACCFFDGDRTFFFSFRAVELRFGSSPEGPVLSALTVLLFFSFTHLSRLYLAVYQVPEVMVENMETVLQPRLKASHDDLNNSLESPIGWYRPSPWGVLPALLLALILFFLTRFDMRLSSIDGRCHNILSIGLTLAAAATLILTSCQVRTLWHSLEGFLACLNTLPLAVRFIRPDRRGGTRPIWVRQLNVQSIDVHARALMVLHDMTLLQPKPGQSRWEKWMKDYVAYVGELMKVETTRVCASAARKNVRTVSKEIAVEAFKIARSKWTSESLVGDSGGGDAPSDNDRTRPRPLLLEIEGDAKQISVLAEVFVALHYTPFLMYCVRQIRNLILFLSLGFLLLVLSMNSYSHQAPQFIGRSLLVLLVFIGGITVRCLLGMERDPILSRIAGTEPGKLSAESYLKVIGYGALPVVGLLASQFPAISNFLYSWIAPTLQALH